MLKRRAAQRVGHAVVVVRRRRWLAGGFLCAVGALALARAWPFTGDPYPPYSGLGLAPHQALIDYVDRLGGVTVWSLPEARDSGEQWFGPVHVAWQTDPYPDDLLRTFRYTAFGAIYEDTTRFDLGGGGWDQLLRQYAAGERSVVLCRAPPASSGTTKPGFYASTTCRSRMANRAWSVLVI